MSESRVRIHPELAATGTLRIGPGDRSAGCSLMASSGLILWEVQRQREYTGIHGNTRIRGTRIRLKPDPGYRVDPGYPTLPGSAILAPAGRQERAFLLLCSRNDGYGGYPGSKVMRAPPVIGYPYLITGGAIVDYLHYRHMAPPVIVHSYLVTGGAIVTW